jgi:hypothetical protein
MASDSEAVLALAGLATGSLSYPALGRLGQSVPSTSRPEASTISKIASSVRVGLAKQGRLRQPWLPRGNGHGV